MTDFSPKIVLAVFFSYRICINAAMRWSNSVQNKGVEYVKLKLKVRGFQIIRQVGC